MNSQIDPIRIMTMVARAFPAALRCMFCILLSYAVWMAASVGTSMVIDISTVETVLSMLSAFLIFFPFLVALKYMNFKYEKRSEGLAQSFYFPLRLLLFLIFFTWLFVLGWSLLLGIMTVIITFAAAGALLLLAHNVVFTSLAALVVLLLACLFWRFIVVRLMFLVDTILNNRALGVKAIRSMMKGKHLKFISTFIGQLVISSIVVSPLVVISILVQDESLQEFVSFICFNVLFLSHLLATAFVFYKKLYADFMINKEMETDTSRGMVEPIPYVGINVPTIS